MNLYTANDRSESNTQATTVGGLGHELRRGCHIELKINKLRFELFRLPIGIHAIGLKQSGLVRLFASRCVASRCKRSALILVMNIVLSRESFFVLTLVRTLCFIQVNKLKKDLACMRQELLYKEQGFETLKE